MAGFALRTGVPGEECGRGVRRGVDTWGALEVDWSEGSRNRMEPRAEWEDGDWSAAPVPGGGVAC